MLIDSGADCVAVKDSRLSRGITSYEVDVGTCNAQGSLRTQGKTDLSLELASGETCRADGAIYAKGLSHNLIGTTVLDQQCGMSTLFHKGSVYLFKADSISGIPSKWTKVAEAEYDKDTGLPFIDFKTKVVSSHSNHQPKVPFPRTINNFGGELDRAYWLVNNKRDCLEAHLIHLAVAVTRTQSDFPTSEAGKRLRYHAKFGHCGSKLVARTRGVAISTSRETPFCESCAMGWGESHAHNANRQKKKKEKLFKTPALIAIDDEGNEIPDSVYMVGQSTSSDMFGPNVRTKGGGRYGMLLMCNRCNFTLGKILARKSDLTLPMCKMIVDVARRRRRFLHV